MSFYVCGSVYLNYIVLCHAVLCEAPALAAHSDRRGAASGVNLGLLSSGLDGLVTGRLVKGTSEAKQTI